jgi:hypothetical protein
MNRKIEQEMREDGKPDRDYYGKPLRQKGSEKRKAHRSTIAREWDQSSKNAGPCEGSIPAKPNAIQKKSGRNAPTSSAQVGAFGAWLLMASPAAKCAAYIRWNSGR